MYVKIVNGAPEKYTFWQLCCDNPATSFPNDPTAELLAEYAVYPCEVAPFAGYDALTHTQDEGTFSQTPDGAWTLQYAAVQLPEGQASQNVRTQRDRLLTETDWVVVKAYECNENVPSQWEIYRQALRDIPSQSGFPFEVTWPAKP